MSTSLIDNQILSIVKQIREEANSANRSYKLEADIIERKSSYTTINVSQMNNALEIIRDSKAALDKLYTTYESLVRMLDMQCRPLADQGASASVIKEVYKLIEHMNSESSSLSGNFTASLNSSDLGDVGGVRYIASLEAQTIEKMWKTRYSMTPEAKEEEAQHKKEEEEARIRLEEERKRKEEEREAKAKKVSDEIAQIEKDNSAAKVHKENITKECLSNVSNFEKNLKAHIKILQEEFKKDIALKLSKLQEEKKNHECILASLGFFKFSEKKQEKKEIIRIETEILKFSSQSIISTETARLNSLAQYAVEKYEEAVKNYLSKRFPLNTEIAHREFSDNNEGLKLRILDLLDRKNFTMTIPEMMEKESTLGEFPEQRISALTRQLQGDEYVFRSIIKGKMCYYISSEGKDFLEKNAKVKPPKKDRENVTIAKRPCPLPPSVESVFNNKKTI